MKAKLIAFAAAAILAMGVSSVWAQGALHQGEVLDTMNGGGYTYVQLKEADKTYWAAGPQTEVTKGDKVEVSEQMWMSDFKSSSLNRTFDKIMFVGNINKK
ncbi:NrfJ [Shewanella sp. SG41-4]|uniref:NrfJ n=1 Tax=Shewanella sp. SG41-4 TaxID=2760976 RepID=UPI00160039ED|nr:NrfJ [Shewanella sp. SG41-4]MBB1441383.1 NrfJ [Shewanella sp. SG41-4]